ncbi:uncharacterized protein K02A2.6-like [Copidosoma floridanum]|uniref:uncharacterized protein K02A2.6-like n=1 Tax=Copidosoma floridanum TaxID=29053 RepID=UPI0006C962FE|nr:uncharacterized protein K02A2.6-like [Copidosoma floridanum]
MTQLQVSDDLRIKLREWVKRKINEGKENEVIILEDIESESEPNEKKKYTMEIAALEQCFIANDIVDKKKMRAILLSKVNADTYDLIDRICKPEKPGEKEYEDIVKLVKNYLKPEASYLVHRAKFRQRLQLENESITEYVAILKNLSKDCKFTQLEEQILDQLITGLRSKDIKMELLKMENPTMATAVKKALACEAAHVGAEKLQRKENSVAQGEIHKVVANEKLKSIIKKHEAVFTGRGKFTKGEVKLELKEEAKPKYLLARSVPFALKERIENELKRLESQGTIEAIKHSEWATPIVPVLKPDGSIRMCADFKVTLNPQLFTVRHPAPNFKHAVAQLQAGVKYSKLDLKEAYLQMPVEEKSQMLLNINTHMGLFKYKYMTFGISSAPEIFQLRMKEILKGIPGVAIVVDDVVVTGKTTDEHLKNLDRVLGKLNECGLKRLVESGWPERKVNGWPNELKSYAQRKDELSVERGCLMWGHRVIIPQKVRKRIVEQLHECHFGIVKMKSLASKRFSSKNGVDAVAMA